MASREPTRRAWLVPALLVSGVLAFCAPALLRAALPLGSDVFITMHYIQAFAAAVADGDLYPRWLAATNQGFGAPTFVLYPPLPWYGAAGAAWLTGSALTGIKLYLLVVSALAALSLYALAREWIGPGWPAAAASVLYLLLPYHVLDFYQRFALSETTAFVFFPLVLLFARRLMDRPQALSFAGLSLSLTGLLYTHLVSAFVFSFLLGPWLLWEARGRWSSLRRPVLAMACAAGLAAPVLLPVLFERSYVNVAFFRDMPNGDFRTNFIFRDDVLPGLGIRDPVKPPVFKSAHAQLALALLAAAISLPLLARGSQRRRDVLALSAACVAAYLMQTAISTPVWRLVPELPTLQFPWRFQALMVVTAALLAGFALAATPKKRGAATVTLAAVLGWNLYLAGETTRLKPYTFDAAALASPEVAGWSEPSFTPTQLDSYRTFRQTEVRMPLAAFEQGEGSVRVIETKTSRRVYDVETSSGGRVAVRCFWFPGWRAWSDAGEIRLTPAPGFGYITFEVPPGRHRVDLRFTATPVRRVAGLVAALAAIVTALAAWAIPRPSHASAPPREDR